MTLKAVFFDLDGTLFDTAGDLAAALNHVLQQHGRAALPLSRIREVVSDGANALLTMAFQQAEPRPDMALLRAELLQSYLDNIAVHTRPFPGIEALIANIHGRGWQWGIATNKPWAYTEALLQHFRFASPPCAVICPEQVTEKKPAPESLFLACQKANCHVNEAVYVGDHVRDIECGKRAGVRATIAAGYGYIPREQDATQWGATWHVAASEELWPLLARQY